MQLLNRHLKDVPSFPEKVLQFGTGVLLRGLPAYFIEKANRNGLFNGSIVAVKSTDTGGITSFERQQGLYTLHIKGFDKGNDVRETWLISSISRVLSAKENWGNVIACAHDPHMAVVLSNSTEIGIVLDETDDVTANPPRSFPAKLTAWLYARFRAFGGAADKGMVILPTELIDQNGEVLRDIVVELARRHQLGQGFIDWLTRYNFFCNTLVDRIVPGRLHGVEAAAAEQVLGYKDELAIVAEPYCLWAIESEAPQVSAVLTFAQADQRVVIAPNIHRFKELKLRLLNGSHTFACGLALACRFETVSEAMNDPLFSDYVTKLLVEEIVPTLPDIGVGVDEAKRFAENVIDRFRNPYLWHHWSSIQLNYEAKMRMRNMATISRYYNRFQSVPPLMALSFAGYLNSVDEDSFAKAVESWKCDLTAFSGFWETVTQHLDQLRKKPAAEVLTEVLRRNA